MVESHRPRVVVFDFDGTLVDSNASKRDAFFELFPDWHEQHPVVDVVLQELGEESRYIILREILARLGESDDARLEAGVERLAKRYNELAFQAASSCPEMPGASHVLAQLARSYALYVSSGTPREPLAALIEDRGWTKHFEDMFGYPSTKVESLGFISETESCDPAAMLVVGDGASDEDSATAMGCGFFPARDDDALTRLAGVLA